MKHTILLFISIIAVFTACVKEDKNDDYKTINEGQDHIVFGKIYGACTDNCSNLYLLTRSNLYEEAETSDDLDNLLFNPDTLSQEKFEIAKHMFDVPTDIVNETFDSEATVNYIADTDFYIRGDIEGNKFAIKYDTINSALSQQLYDYSILVEVVLDNLGAPRQF